MMNDKQLNDAESYLRISITELPELDLKNIPFAAYPGISQVMVNYAAKSRKDERIKVIDEMLDWIYGFNKLSPRPEIVFGEQHPLKPAINKLNQLKEQS